MSARQSGGTIEDDVSIATEVFDVCSLGWDPEAQAIHGAVDGHGPGGGEHVSAGNAAIAVAFVSCLTVFWPAVGDDALLGALVGIALIWLLTLTNLAGVREGGIVQLVTTVLKSVPLAVIGIVGLCFIDGGNYEPFRPAAGA